MRRNAAFSLSYLQYFEMARQGDLANNSQLRWTLAFDCDLLAMGVFVMQFADVFHDLVSCCIAWHLRSLVDLRS